MLYHPQSENLINAKGLFKMRYVNVTEFKANLLSGRRLITELTGHQAEFRMKILCGKNSV